MAGGAVVGGAAVWATLRFGVLAFLVDDQHPARPMVEALSWVAGIGGLPIGVLALVVSLRQGRDAPAEPATGLAAGSVAGSAAEPAAGSVTGLVAEPAPAPERIPASTDRFVGRSSELERLDESVRRSGRAVVVAVHGLGGVGKSTLASHFAHRHRERYTVVWWITADSPMAIDTGLADLAMALTGEGGDLPLKQRTESAVRWLAAHDEWLLVLDNLTTLADASGLLERVGTGTIVITSRQGSGWRGVETIPLDVLPAEEARVLLARVVHAEWPDAELPGADRLCEELGWLPLAVEQAGAYLAQTRITPVGYLNLLTRYPARIFNATAEGGDAQRTMARVWHLTLDKLTETPLAGEVLRRLAWYAPEAIPRYLITAGDEPDLLHALGRLAAYSMITLTAETVSVHRLVQAVARTPDPDDPHRQPQDITTAREAATEVLADSAGGLDYRVPEYWPRYRATLPHAQALFDHSNPDMDIDSTCLLLTRLGNFLHDQGSLSRAISLLTRNLDSIQRLHGADHPDTLASRNNLASAYKATGDLQRAITLYETTLTDRKRILGPDHPDTLTSRNNLAGAYEATGDLQRAITLYETTLTDSERILGPDHPDTLTSRNNLATAYKATGDLQRAITFHETTLTDSERILGPDHPNTLTSRNNLAGAYQTAGDLQRAITLHKTTLTDSERILGPDHPNTLTSRNNLAGAYQTAGDLQRAIPLYESILADCERVLGGDHPLTRTVKNNLEVARHGSKVDT